MEMISVRTPRDISTLGKASEVNLADSDNIKLCLDESLSCDYPAVNHSIKTYSSVLARLPISQLER